MATLCLNRDLSPDGNITGILPSVRLISLAGRLTAAKETPSFVKRRQVMTDELKEMLDAAKRAPMSSEDREAQRRSFAYGNAHIENDRVTWEMVNEAATRIAHR